MRSMKRQNWFKRLAALVAVLAALVISGCTNSAVDTAMGAGSYDLPDYDVSQPVQEPAPEPETVDFDNIPASMSPIEGYYPYVVKFYNMNGDLLSDMAPYLRVMEGSTVHIYTMQEAEREGLVTELKAYDSYGTELDASKLLTWQDEESGSLYAIGSCACSFYLKEGVSAELLPLSGSDLLQFHDATVYYTYWGAALVDRIGWEGEYLICPLEAPVDGGDTAINLTCTLDFHQFNSNIENVVHYYSFLSNITSETLPLGGAAA